MARRPLPSWKTWLVTLSILLIGLPLLLLWPSLPASAQTAAPNWTYRDTTGPDHWASLDPVFGTCASGQSQSPINLTASDSVDLANPVFHYEPAPLNLLNNGHTVQVPYAPGSYITLNGTQYNLLQFHFHSPSEHTTDGNPWDAELHLVHQSDDGALAVVAVLLQADENDSSPSTYDAITQNLPTKAGDKVRTGEKINAQTLLPSQTTTYRYSGSLTTPPCSESVTWLVMTEPVVLPEKQLAHYKTLLENNNRPLQQRNKRAVQMDISP